MLPLTEAQLRASFVNVSLRERKAVIMPDLSSVDWESLDCLGWRDPKQPKLGYVVCTVDDRPVGALLRQSDGSTISRPQCSWCEDVHLPNDVVLFSARLAGKAGRAGDTIATLVCDEFQCSENVRRLPVATYDGHDVWATRDRRIAQLQQHAERFLRRVRDGRED